MKDRRRLSMPVRRPGLTAADEPRPGLRRGHIPGALNVPWTDLVINGELKTVDELNDIFLRQGVDFERPIIASCGSGVTAAVVVLALTTLGVNGVCLYDGSGQMGRAERSAD